MSHGQSSQFQAAPPIHRPAVLAVLALGLGVTLDHHVVTPMIVWQIAVAIFLILAVASHVLRRERIGSLLVVGLCFCLGGLRSHQVHHVRSSSNIATFAGVEPQPIRLSGVINSAVEIIESEHGPRIPSWMEVDQSRCTLKCELLSDAGKWRAVTGQVRFNLNGHLTHVSVGDRVEILGELSVPSPPHNPGSFDYGDYLNRQNIDAIVNADHPECVTIIEPASGWESFFSRLRERIRSECQRQFFEHLSAGSRTVAASLLIGDRSQLSDEMQDSFRESGTMHLLAISGLHVGILAGFVTLLCRITNLSHTWTVFTIVLVITLYAALTNHRPPVIRAALLIALVTLGVSRARSVEMLNLLACCAGILILIRPGDLFDIGAQLSFLAVAAIIWSHSYLKQRQAILKENQLPPAEEWAWLEQLRPFGKWIFQGYVITAAIWAVTLPITISKFRLVAPIGFLLNIVLIPVIVIVLGLGYLFLVLSLFLPWACGPIGMLFDWSLRGLLSIVRFGQQVPFGHAYPAGFPEWWLAGFYVLLLAVLFCSNSVRLRRRVQRVLLVWCLFGLSLGLIKYETSELRLTVLSVGHGLASVIELPNGEIILYDTGNSGDGKRSEQTVERFLWSRNIQRIDAVVISHADHDHYSGLFGILERFPIGTIFISQPFVDFQQQGVVDICESAARFKIPLRIVQSGDSLVSGNNNSSRSATIEILHPPPQFNSESDNANSVVLSVAYQGRKVLLTGDLELDGLDSLLSQPSQDFDVLMSPHHGSEKSNPQSLLKWAGPGILIVSTNDRAVGPRLRSQVDQSMAVRTTVESGAVAVVIDQQGEIQMDEFLSRSHNTIAE